MGLSVQKNFRLSAKARKVLRNAALQAQMTETDVVEHCIARYALELGVEVERAKALLLEHLAQGVAASQTGSHF